MVGQTEINKMFDALTIDTLKSSNILIGDVGCGKHLLCQMISEKFNIPLIDISKNISLQSINNLYLNPNVSLCLIDGNGLTEKSNNTILKLLEEPPKNVFIFILVNNESFVLPTILNRCYRWAFIPYTKQELEVFIPIGVDKVDKEYILNIAQTPGQVKTLLATNIREIVEYANYIIDKINVASFSNLFNISEKLYFIQEDKEKISCYVLLKLILHSIKNRLIQSHDDRLIKASVATTQILYDFRKSQNNRQQMFERYLFILKGILS